MTDLEHILEAANDVVDQIEDTRKELQDQASHIGGALNAAEDAVKAITDRASYLVERIEAVRIAAPHKADPVAEATITAIDNLIALLTDARKYLADGNKLAAIGTLASFDYHAEDLRAAFHLTKMQQRRQP